MRAQLHHLWLATVWDAVLSLFADPGILQASARRRCARRRGSSALERKPCDTARPTGRSRGGATMAHDMFRFDDDLPEAERHLLVLIRKTLWTMSRCARPGRSWTSRSARDWCVCKAASGPLRSRRLPSSCCSAVPGIRAVGNDLISDPEVVRAVADAIAADPELGPTCPIIESRDGVVILAGTMPSEDLARRAVEVATSVPMVASVNSHLRSCRPRLRGCRTGLANGAVAVARPTSRIRHEPGSGHQAREAARRA